MLQDMQQRMNQQQEEKHFWQKDIMINILMVAIHNTKEKS